MSSSRSGPSLDSRSKAMRPPPARTATAKNSSGGPGLSAGMPFSRTGTISPAHSLDSSVTSPPVRSNGIKRKEREYDPDGGEESNINVVVRCRGRNERELKENSGVVVTTNGVRGSHVELSMGPNALSNKTYHFDKVFSPAADQSMLFDDVVVPVLDEMLQGFNCTIFAYGQTGTGKTYTMTGDMSQSKGVLADSAGIIPRVLHSLFRKLESEEGETSVKCSFIELYNEELRDLLTLDDSVKLKIYEDTQKKGQTATLVQGMEEAYIKTAKDGISLLQSGSHKRQVAATKCNDLSSRSHSVFTVTAYMKKSTESGEEIVCAGKLNLVDLAGSENIQRSGAENKRAAEAGLINKSLLTLGRVINSLVERGSHIPYRESKLTRLLQDSLGGRTKTCIIATISPAKSNVEETISTLDYAFRAKNIKNKPQVNQMISKKTMLRDFTSEIEKLKSELMATRQRNGVYLTAEGYEEMVGASESRRLLSEEQAQRIEAMEASLRVKVQELATLTDNFDAQKKDNATTKKVLEETKSVLEQTDTDLSQTKQALADETTMRQAHQATETSLHNINGQLMETVVAATSDAQNLHCKVDRQALTMAKNDEQWSETQHGVVGIARIMEDKLAEFQSNQSSIGNRFSTKLEAIFAQELASLRHDQDTLDTSAGSINTMELDLAQYGATRTSTMNDTLEEIKDLREQVKTRLGQGLHGLSSAASRISAEVINELGSFHGELQTSYTTLGNDLKKIFGTLASQLGEQKIQAQTLQRQISEAAVESAEASKATSQRLATSWTEERQQMDVDRQALLQQIAALVNSSSQAQSARWQARIGSVDAELAAASDKIITAERSYSQGMAEQCAVDDKIVQQISEAQAQLQNRIEGDWQSMRQRNGTIQETTKSVHGETVEIVEAQITNMAEQMQALDEFVTRARQQNDAAHEGEMEKVHAFASAMKKTNQECSDNVKRNVNQVQESGECVQSFKQELQGRLPEFAAAVGHSLEDLKGQLHKTTFKKCKPTGSTPPKTEYKYPTVFPSTEPPERLIGRPLVTDLAVDDVSNVACGKTTHANTKPQIYVDNAGGQESVSMTPSPASQTSDTPSLREVSSNVNARSARMNNDREQSEMPLIKKLSNDLLAVGQPPLKRQATDGKAVGKVSNIRTAPGRYEGRENVMAGRRLRSSAIGR